MKAKKKKNILYIYTTTAIVTCDTSAVPHAPPHRRFIALSCQ